MMQALMRSNTDQPGSTELEEMELARELLEIQSDEELDHFFPLLLPALKAAIPILSKVAGPLVKNLAGSLLGGGDSAEDGTEGGDGGAGTGGGGGGGGGGIEQSARRRQRRRPRRRLRRRARTRSEFEHEQFIGKVIGGLFGEMEAESEEEEQFIGRLLGGLLGKRELETEEEQFIGKILGGLFGGRNRAIQEQFLGGVLGKILGGELETEEELGLPQAQRFIHLARNALRTAGLRLESMLRSGRRPSLAEAQRIVFRAIVSTTRHLAPGPGEAHHARAYEFESHPRSHGSRGRWVRSGSRIIIDLPM